VAQWGPAPVAVGSWFGSLDLATRTLAAIWANQLPVSGAITSLPQQAPAFGEVAGGAQGVGVVGAQHPALAVQGVLVQLAGRLHLPQIPQIGGEVAGGAEGVGVVSAQDLAAAVQRGVVKIGGGPHIP
jgi:hypothetical protein